METGLENEAWIHIKTIDLLADKKLRASDPQGTERWPKLLREVHRLRVLLDDDDQLSKVDSETYYKANILNAALEVFRYDIELLKRCKNHCLASSRDSQVSSKMRATYLFMFHILSECSDIANKRRIHRSQREKLKKKDYKEA